MAQRYGLALALMVAGAAAATAQDQSTRSLLLRGSNTNISNMGTVTVGTLTAPRTYTYPDYSGTVLVLPGGGGLTDGQLLIGRTNDVPVAANLTGTINQIAIQNGPGSITLSLPQDIHDNATPTFDGLTLDNLAANNTATNYLVIDGSGNVGFRTLAGSFWELDGNDITSGTDRVDNVLGTVSGSTLANVHIMANGQIVGSFLPATLATDAGSFNLGYSGNTIGGTGNAIVGGGRNAASHSATGAFSVIAGGIGHEIGIDATRGAIVAGQGHEIVLIAENAFIGGGVGASISDADNAAIVGGNGNIVREGANNSAVVGGTTNDVREGGGNSVIAGGRNHVIRASASDFFIGGGDGNLATDGASLSAMIGGSANTLRGSAQRSAIVGGSNHLIADGASQSAIIAGSQHTITNSASLAAIVGGEQHRMDAGAQRSVILGGLLDTISGSASNAAIVAGRYHYVGDGATSSIVIGGDTNVVRGGASQAAIIAGRGNLVTDGGSFSAIVAGTNNVVRASATRSVIAGGQNNFAGDGATHSGIFGGRYNELRAGASRGTIVGGDSNLVRASNGSILGGAYNVVDFSATYGVVLGGDSNRVETEGSGILAGRSNRIHQGATRSAIIGGDSNHIRSSAALSAIVAGSYNLIEAGSARSAILGGSLNTINSGSANNAIIGGSENVVGEGTTASTILSSTEVLVGAGTAQITALSSSGLTVRASNVLAMHNGAAAEIQTSNIAYFGNTNVWIGNNDGTTQSDASELRFYSPGNAASGLFPALSQRYSAFRASAAQTSSDITYTLPATLTAGTTVEAGILQTDASGNLSWLEPTALAPSVDEGLQVSGGVVRLGATALGANPIVSERYITIETGGELIVATDDGATSSSAISFQEVANNSALTIEKTGAFGAGQGNWVTGLRSRGTNNGTGTNTAVGVHGIGVTEGENSYGVVGDGFYDGTSILTFDPNTIITGVLGRAENNGSELLSIGGDFRSLGSAIENVNAGAVGSANGAGSLNVGVVGIGGGDILTNGSAILSDVFSALGTTSGINIGVLAASPSPTGYGLFVNGNMYINNGSIQAGGNLDVIAAGPIFSISVFGAAEPQFAVNQDIGFIDVRLAMSNLETGEPLRIYDLNGVDVTSGALTLGSDAGAVAGSIIFHDTDLNNTFTGTLQTPSVYTASRTYTWPDRSGTIVVSSSANGAVDYGITSAQNTLGTVGARLFDVAYSGTYASDAFGARINATTTTLNAPNLNATSLTLEAVTNGTGFSTGLSVSASGSTIATNNNAIDVTAGNVRYGTTTRTIAQPNTDQTGVGAIDGTSSGSISLASRFTKVTITANTDPGASTLTLTAGVDGEEAMLLITCDNSGGTSDIEVELGGNVVATTFVAGDPERTELLHLFYSDDFGRWVVLSQQTP